jgi:tetratricopeptide (TPR) repeat protein
MGSDRAKTVQDAERFMKSGKIGDAISVYRKIAEDNPRDLNTTNKLGDLLVKAGKAQEAMRYFLRIAEFYAKDGFYLKAIAMYKKMTKIDASSLDCQVRLADLYHQQGLAIEAKAQYLQVADHLIKAGHFGRAIEVLPKVVELDPDNLKVRMMLADLLGRTDKHDDAAAAFAGVVEVLHRNGSTDEAIKVARRGLKASPASGAIIARMLVILRSMESPTKEFLALAEEMAAGHGKSPRVLALLGEARRRAGREDDSEEVLDRLVALDELQNETLPEVMEVAAHYQTSKQRIDEAFTWVSKGTAEYRRAARHAEATSLVDEFLEAFPDHRGALTLRSEAPAQEAPGESAESTLESPDEPSKEAARPKPAPAKPAPPPARSTKPAAIRNAEVEGLQGLDDLDLVIEGDEPAIETEDSAPAVPAPGKPPATAAKAAAAVPKAAPRTAGAVPVPAISSGGPPEEAAEYGPGSKIQEIQAVDEDGEPEDEDFITEHLTEADVFVKYGLLDKAKQQLTAVLSRYPRHVGSRTRLKEIYCEEGNKDKAVEECLRLAEIMKAQGSDDEARDLVNEAVRIEPSNERITRFNSSAGETEAEPARREKPTSAATRGAGAPEIEPGPVPEVSAAGEEEATPDQDFEIEIEGIGEEDEKKAPVAKRAQKVQKIEEETPDDLGAGLNLDLGAGDSTPDGEIEKMMGGSPPSDPDSEKLGEIDFYIDQGLLDEAREVIAQLQKQFPKSEEVARRASRVAQAEEEAQAPPPKASPEEPTSVDLEVERVFGSQTMKMSPPKAPAGPRASKPATVFKVESSREGETGDFIDLASELEQSLAEAQRDVSAQDQKALEGPGHTLDEIFKAFKQGVEQQVDSRDFDTHYNLGIAYKEMGLVDEAIGEFQFVARDPARLVECCGILGLCFRDKGMPELALKWYRKGLDMPNVGEYEAIGLRYDIAEVYHEQGDHKSALKFYTEVFGMDSTYRDVAAKIRDLRARKS